MHCQLRSADRSYFDGDASMVVANSPRGEFAVMEGHAPLLAVLDRGAVRIHTESGPQVFACRRGTLRTTGDCVHVLVEAAYPLDEIDPEAIDAQLAALDENAPAEEREYLASLRVIKERHG